MGSGPIKPVFAALNDIWRSFPAAQGLYEFLFDARDIGVKHAFTFGAERFYGIVS